MSSIGVGICGVHWMQMETYMDGECSRGTERHYESLSGHARLVGTASRVPVIKGLLEAWRPLSLRTWTPKRARRRPSHLLEDLEVALLLSFVDFLRMPRWS